MQRVMTRTISLYPDLDQKLKAQARAERRPISEVARYAIKTYLETVASDAREGTRQPEGAAR